MRNATRRFGIVWMLVLGLTAGAFLWTADEVYARGDGVTCGWCGYTVFAGNDTIHGFYDEEGDKCGWPRPDGGDGTVCARCNGTSDCHTGWDNGGCHLQCGPGGGLASAKETLTKALAEKNVEVVLGMIATASPDASR